MSNLSRHDALSRTLLVVALIFIVVVTRLMPRPPNFSPVEAAALFAGATFVSWRLAVLVPLIAMLISDWFIGFHDGMWLVYGCMAVIALAGTRLKDRISPLRVAGYGISAAVFFFLVTNFAVWAGGTMYPHTASGLLACYVAAVPFFHNQIAGVLVYSLLLFGAHALFTRRSRIAAA